MTWKEQLLRDCYLWYYYDEDTQLDFDELRNFISTQIIEKLIADIPDNILRYGSGENVSRPLKQQLRDKWL